MSEQLGRLRQRRNELERSIRVTQIAMKLDKRQKIGTDTLIAYIGFGAILCIIFVVWFFVYICFLRTEQIQLDDEEVYQQPEEAKYLGIWDIFVKRGKVSHIWFATHTYLLSLVFCL